MMAQNIHMMKYSWPRWMKQFGLLLVNMVRSPFPLLALHCIYHLLELGKHISCKDDGHCRNGE